MVKKIKLRCLDTFTVFNRDLNYTIIDSKLIKLSVSEFKQSIRRQKTDICDR